MPERLDAVVGENLIVGAEKLPGHRQDTGLYSYLWFMRSVNKFSWLPILLVFALAGWHHFSPKLKELPGAIGATQATTVDFTATIFPYGQPKGRETLLLLENKGYTVGYSTRQKSALWSAYRLTKSDNPKSEARPEEFREDERVPSAGRTFSSNYTGSGYDRGHLAPNYAISTRYGREAQVETFLMSNIIPQQPNLNRGIWASFEKMEANDYANRFGEIWTVTGPVFDGNPTLLRNTVPIPYACYKIILRKTPEPEFLAVIVEQTVPDSKSQDTLNERLVTVHDIEQLTGLFFFPELPAEHPSRTRKPVRVW